MSIRRQHDPATTIERLAPLAALLSTLIEDELLAADHRYPKWATMCQLRRLGLPTLDAVLITPHQDHLALEGAVTTLASATGQDRLMVRSDGGAETHRYYRGGNTFPISDAAAKATGLLKAGRAVILMEPTNRFTNCLAAVLRIDRDSRGRNGRFTVEALGSGYDVADLTRGGIPPQVTVTADADWSVYPDLWWSDLRMSTDIGPEAECDRRRRRLARIATDILTDTGDFTGTPTTGDEQAVEAAAWLREHGYHQLWGDFDVALKVTRRIRRWFEDAFMIGLCHPRRGWTCLATAFSDLGGRCVFWDIVDGSRKYSTRRPT
jgi:hypothetical protein